MKICSSCGASNSDRAKFCNECGTDLATAKAPPPPFSGSGTTIDRSVMASALAGRAHLFQQGKKKADILFVLDCTGSMQGEIDAIRAAIAAFADTIQTEGVRARVGLVEFRDRLIQEEHRVVLFAGNPFTDNPEIFRQEIARIHAHGGGDEPESSLDALMLALRQPFAADASKVIVLVTDAPPHIPDKETPDIETVVQQIATVGLDQLYLVIRTQSKASQVYLRLLEKTRGLAFDLGQGDDFGKRAEDFKRTLMGLGKTISVGTK